MILLRELKLKLQFLGPPGRAGELGDYGEIGSYGEKGFRVCFAWNCYWKFIENFKTYAIY